jgi:Na+-driven multidrug efflux pump
MLGLLPLNGMAASMIPFMSFNNAQMKVERINEGIKYFLLLATVFILPIIMIFIAFPHILLLLFQAEGKIMELGSYAVRVAALGYILVPIDLALFSLAQGLQKPVYPLFTLILRILVFRYPLAVYFAATWGVRSVYWCEPVSMGVAAIFSAFLLWRLTNGLKSVVSRY